MAEWEPKTFIHGSKLLRKAERAQQDSGLQTAVVAYERWKTESLSVVGRDPAEIEKLVGHLNTYKDCVEPIFDLRPNSAQEVLQSSIIEEFFEYLFGPLQVEMGAGGICQPSPAYLDLVFHPKTFSSLTTRPDYTIGRKDHDFVIGAKYLITLQVDGRGEQTEDSFVIPAVALETKRYLERNMLDECAGTAARVKRATPYCLFLVIAEFLKMDDARPELSRIDEVYILRRQRNSARLDKNFIPNPISAELVGDIYVQVLTHLRRIWWDPASALTTGKLFSYR
jgi:hypothetical protein